MARRIGAHFLQAAHGPLAFAASCIAHNQILKGIEELAPGGLAGGLLRGVNDVAAEAGVPPREVQSLLPWGELARAAKQLEVAQPAALRAWKIHAGAYGFLDLVTQLTVDGRPIDVRQGLTRLAGKVRADEGLAGPLATLGEAAGAWEDLVLRCGALLDDGEGLARAFHLRRRRRIAAGAVAGTVMSIAIGVIAWTAMARARVASVLREADPCTAHGIASADRELASNEQDRAIGDAERRCAAGRIAEAEARARAEREAEHRAREAREAEARDVGCRRLASRLADGPAEGATDDRDGSTGGAVDSGAGLASRIARRRLAAEDLGPDEPSLACWTDPASPPEARRAIDTAFADALFAMTEWPGVIDPSPRVAALLEGHRDRIAPWQLGAVAERAKRLADASLVAGRADDVARARRLCALAGRLGRPGGTSCVAVDGVAAR